MQAKTKHEVQKYISYYKYINQIKLQRAGPSHLESLNIQQSNGNTVSPCQNKKFMSMFKN